LSILRGISEAGSKVINFLRAGISEGLSGKSILEALRSEGLGYRTSDFYSDLGGGIGYATSKPKKGG